MGRYPTVSATLKASCFSSASISRPKELENNFRDSSGVIKFNCCKSAPTALATSARREVINNRDWELATKKGLTLSGSQASSTTSKTARSRSKLRKWAEVASILIARNS